MSHTALCKYCVHVGGKIEACCSFSYLLLSVIICIVDGTVCCNSSVMTLCYWFSLQMTTHCKKTIFLILLNILMKHYLRLVVG